jgi:hypothetical protein
VTCDSRERKKKDNGFLQQLPEEYHYNTFKYGDRGWFSIVDGEVLDGREIGVRFPVGAEIFRFFAPSILALRTIQSLIPMLPETPSAKIKWVECEAILSYTSSTAA